MPRRRQSIQPGSIYHLISRCVAREWFICGDEERERYLRLLGERLARSDWRCLAYAIMSNHVHLALLAGAASLKSWLAPTHSEFAEWINARLERIGAVFVRGPKILSVGDNGLAQVISYIHRNPVRAGIVANARDSTWTSHRAYLGDVATPTWLDTNIGLQRSGLLTPAELDAWVSNPANDARFPSRLRGRPKTVQLRPTAVVRAPRWRFESIALLGHH
jgi:putative transposase